ncbi:Translocation protein S66 [Elasticomyces elasticus]|nr:Translocation protein S66 [Elasticomyces elasticus]
MVDWISLAIPVAYLSILIGSLATFSSLYRKRKAAKSASLEPWFPPHLQRNIYLSLLHLDPAEASASSGSEKTLSRVPDSILKAALMRRAVEDIHRIVQLRNAKPALQTLLQRGSIGDELQQRFARAEQEMQAEIQDVVEEANAFSLDWGQLIFQSASEMAHNAFLRQRMTELQAKTREEREWWDKKKAGIQSSFMKELESAEKSDSKKGPVIVPSAVPRKSSSDEDTVLVESGGPAGALGGQAGGAKKKKGKK